MPADPDRGASDAASDAGIEAGIVTATADRLTQFYVAAFAMTIEHRFTFPQGIVVRLRRGPARLKLYQPAEGLDPEPTPEPWFRDTGFAYAAWHTTDVAATVDAVTAAGGTVTTAPTAHRPGALYALVRDPEGNTWELLSEA